MAIAVTVYFPGAIFSKLKLPEALTTMVLITALSLLRAMVIKSIGLFVAESITEPLIVPVGDCAATGKLKKIERQNKNNKVT